LFFYHYNQFYGILFAYNNLYKRNYYTESPAGILRKTDSKVLSPLLLKNTKNVINLLKECLYDKPYVFEFIEKQINLYLIPREQFEIIDQAELKNFSSYYESKRLIINLLRINDIQKINYLFAQINRNLTYNGYFIGCVRTNYNWRIQIKNSYPRIIYLSIYVLNFVFHRVFPKFSSTNVIYTFFTKGLNKAISKTEVLGRLYATGFKVVSESYIDGLLYFIVQKNKEPMIVEEKKYGLIIRLKRIGKSGKLINVYKLRTMHSYSEYLQEYMYLNNSLQEGGKFKDDFRITGLGSLLRKYWIDELCMLINLIKGDMKLVGVRPLSEQYLGLYKKEVVEKRIKVKPGLFPPFYADLPNTLDDIMESELKYLNLYEKNPYRTDCIYFFKIIYNIIIKKVRSK
jgi:lipopolysaccharide/colanic/teichoic acid biosynthesis glycosyltransferase